MISSFKQKVLKPTIYVLFHRHTDTHTHRHTDTQAHRHTDTQAHRHTDTQTHRHFGEKHHAFLEIIIALGGIRILEILEM